MDALASNTRGFSVIKWEIGSEVVEYGVTYGDTTRTLPTAPSSLLILNLKNSPKKSISKSTSQAKGSISFKLKDLMLKKLIGCCCDLNLLPVFSSPLVIVILEPLNSPVSLGSSELIFLGIEPIGEITELS